MIPQTFEEWRSCIIRDCRIDLTKDFAKARLTIYEDPNHQETRKFSELYGEQHLQNVIQWLKRI